MSKSGKQTTTITTLVLYSMTMTTIMTGDACAVKYARLCLPSTLDMESSIPMVTFARCQRVCRHHDRRAAPTRRSIPTFSSGPTESPPLLSRLGLQLEAIAIFLTAAITESARKRYYDDKPTRPTQDHPNEMETAPQEPPARITFSIPAVKQRPACKGITSGARRVETVADGG